MDFRTNNFINPNMIKSVENKKATQFNKPINNKQQQVGNTFNSVLSNLIEEKTSLQVSKHASTRLNSRDINLTQSQMERVQKGVDSAKGKGINESLILVDDVALVVSVKKNTIITVMDSEAGKNKVFTNIDGAIIV